MAKLKLRVIEDAKPVKLTIEFPAALHQDLIAYGELLGREANSAALDPVKLIGPMLARFMATDRAFAKARRKLNLSSGDQKSQPLASPEPTPQNG